MLWLSFALAQSCEVVCDGVIVASWVADPSCDPAPGDTGMPPGDTAPPPVTADTGDTFGPAPLHVVLVIVDDMGWGSPSYMGGPAGSTPRIDSLAAQSLDFHQFYSPGNCSPARASVQLGRHGIRDGVEDVHHSINTAAHPYALANILSAEGWSTGWFGKWHLDGTTADNSTPGYPVFASDYDPSDLGWQTWRAFNGRIDQDPFWVGTEAGIEQVSGAEPSALAALALDHITTAPGNTLTVLAPSAPHFPFTPDPADAALFASLNTGSENYYGEVHELDRGIGVLLDGITAAGIEASTVVWVISDNGAQRNDFDTGHTITPSGNAPLRRWKGETWEGGVRVTSMIRAPGNAPGVVTGPGFTADVAPTVLAWAGVSDAGLLQPQDGIDLSAVTASIVRPSPVALGVDDWPRAIVGITGQWKHRAGTTARLYDLNADMGEATDLSIVEPVVLADLQAALASAEISWASSDACADYPGATCGSEQSQVNWWTTPGAQPHLATLCADPNYAGTPACP